jgi:hypothetical protein
VLVECEGEVAGAAAEVEDDGLGALEDGVEGAGGAVPPGAVEADGEDVVGAVVGGGDGGEHLLDVLGGCGGVGDAVGTGSGRGVGLGMHCIQCRWRLGWRVVALRIIEVFETIGGEARSNRQPMEGVYEDIFEIDGTQDGTKADASVYA